jgi:hypothetical protein
MQVITESGKHTFSVKRGECVSLELKLNVTSKGHVWQHIGDYLMEYGTGRAHAVSEIVVTDDQYEFLIMLLGKRSWEDCVDL